MIHDGHGVPGLSPCSRCPGLISLFPLGLAELAARKYKQAAKCFLLASFDHCDFPEVRRHEASSACPGPQEEVGWAVSFS